MAGEKRVLREGGWFLSGVEIVWLLKERRLEYIIAIGAHLLGRMREKDLNTGSNLLPGLNSQDRY